MSTQVKSLMMAIALVLLAAASQVQAAQYLCRSINVCDGAVDSKWTQQTVSKSLDKLLMFKKQKAWTMAFNTKPAKSACITNACKSPLTVNMKLPATTPPAKLDSFIAAATKKPTLLSPEATCVEDNTDALIAMDSSCMGTSEGVKGSMLCRSAKVCSDMEDFKWVEQRSMKDLAAFLKKRGLSSARITVAKDSAPQRAGCSCQNPAVLTVMVKVPSSISMAKLDAELAAELKGVVIPKLQPKCSSDASAALVAANPVCKKLPAPMLVAKTVKPGITTLCKSVEVCDNSVDFKWTANTLRATFATLYESLGLTQSAKNFQVTQLPGTKLSVGATSCTCANKALVKINVLVEKPTSGLLGSGGAYKVDVFLATLKPKLAEAQCLAVTSDSCNQEVAPGATCRSWTLCDNSQDFAWIVSRVKAALSPCFSAAKTPSSALKITQLPGTCATISGSQCCCAKVASIKVDNVAAGKGAAFDACAKAAMKLPSKALTQAKCLGASC